MPGEKNETKKTTTMAQFEGLYEFTDTIVSRCNELEIKATNHPDRVTRQMYRIEQRIWFQSLIVYYETVCRHGKFKSQKQHVVAAIRELNPAFADGYFNTKNQKHHDGQIQQQKTGSNRNR